MLEIPCTNKKFKKGKFRHVTESKWNLKPFFKPKLKPKKVILNCHPGRRAEEERRRRSGDEEVVVVDVAAAEGEDPGAAAGKEREATDGADQAEKGGDGNIGGVCTMWGVPSFVMFCFGHFRKFRFPIGLHSNISICPTAGGTGQNCSTKYHE